MNRLFRETSNKATKKATSTLYICMYCGMLTTNKEKNDKHIHVLG